MDISKHQNIERCDEMKWMYYESEDGCPREITLQQLKEYFENTEGLEEQKREGTTFESWLDEMEKMQILNRKDDDIKILPTVGNYIPADNANGTKEIFEKEYYGQGMIYKNWDNFVNHPDEVCYVPELSNNKYTKQDLIDLCGGNTKMAEIMFDELDWQHPESLLADWECNGEIGVCDRCGWIYSYDDELRCPNCGAKLKEVEGI